jgi:hypothetical protein
VESFITDSAACLRAAYDCEQHRAQRERYFQPFSQTVFSQFWHDPGKQQIR